MDNKIIGLKSWNVRLLLYKYNYRVHAIDSDYNTAEKKSTCLLQAGVPFDHFCLSVDGKKNQRENICMGMGYDLILLKYEVFLNAMSAMCLCKDKKKNGKRKCWLPAFSSFHPDVFIFNPYSLGSKNIRSFGDWLTFSPLKNQNGNVSINKIPKTFCFPLCFIEYRTSLSNVSQTVLEWSNMIQFHVHSSLILIYTVLKKQ